MIGKSQLCKIAVFSVLALVMMSPAGYATILAPGGSATPPENFAAGFIGATLADTGSMAVVGVGGAYAGTVRERVVTDLNTGNLDFIYQFLRNTTSGPDPISEITVTNFAPTIDDVGVCTACADLIAGVTTYAAASEDERSSVGDVIRWNYPTSGIPGTSASNILVIKTNAKSWVPGNINLIDGGTTTVAGFAPTPEPVTAGLLLGVLFGAGLFVARRFRVVQS